MAKYDKSRNMRDKKRKKKNFQENKKDYERDSGKRSDNPQRDSVPARVPGNCDPRDIRRNLDGGTTNDIKWWNRAGWLYDQATRIPFSHIPGSTLDVGLDDSAIGATINKVKPVNPVHNGYAIPGIMTIDFIPFPGYSSDGNSPLNRAFTSLMAQIYAKTTGVPPFTQASLAFLVTSMSSILANIGYAKKVIEYSYDWSPDNLYYPVQLLKAMGIVPNSVIGNQDDCISDLNEVISNFNGIEVPAFVTAFDQAYTMSHVMWTDGATNYKQLYNFRPVGDYTYSDTDNKLTYSQKTPAGINPMTFSEWIAIIDRQLEVWRNSSDLPLILGAIRRAFDKAKCVYISPMTTGEKAVPVASPEILSQISNATFIGYPSSVSQMHNSGLWTDMDVTEDVVKNLLLCKPRASLALTGATSLTGAKAGTILNVLRKKLLRTITGDTSSDYCMEATRYTVVAEIAPNGDGLTNNIYLSNVGTMLLCAMWVGVMANNSSLNMHYIPQVINTNETKDTATGIDTVLLQDAMEYVSPFAARPSFFTITMTSGQTDWLTALNSGNYVMAGPITSDIANVTTLSKYQITQLNRAALFSVYMPPEDVNIINGLQP